MKGKAENGVLPTYLEASRYLIFGTSVARYSVLSRDVDSSALVWWGWGEGGKHREVYYRVSARGQLTNWLRPACHARHSVVEVHVPAAVIHRDRFPPNRERVHMLRMIPTRCLRSGVVKVRLAP